MVVPGNVAAAAQRGDLAIVQSYKRYLRAPHRQFLRLLSLLVRRREDRTNRLLLERLRTVEYACFGSVPVWKSAELHLLQRIARLPNGPCWNVLSYWRDPERETE